VLLFFRLQHRLFFLNRSEDATAIVLSNIGVQKYPSYFYLDDNTLVAKEENEHVKIETSSEIQMELSEKRTAIAVVSSSSPINSQRVEKDGGNLSINLEHLDDGVQPKMEEMDIILNTTIEVEETLGLVDNNIVIEEKLAVKKRISFSEANMKYLKIISVFRSRKELNEYEDALQLSTEFSELVEFNENENGDKISEIPLFLQKV
jgi:hypothetical protein